MNSKEEKIFVWVLSKNSASGLLASFRTLFRRRGRAGGVTTPLVRSWPTGVHSVLCSGGGGGQAA